MLNPSVDQAAGLRRLFTPAMPKFLPVVAGAHGTGHTTVVTWLAAALAGQGARVLVIDGARGRVARSLGRAAGAPPQHDLLDLLAGEREFDEVAVFHNPSLAVLPAQLGLAEMVEGGYGISHLQDAIAGLSTPFDLIVILAGAEVIGPLFAGTEAHALVLASPRPEAVTTAYAAMKLMAVEHGLKRFQLAVNQAQSEAEAIRVAERLDQCARRFFEAGTQLAGVLPFDSELARGAPSPGAFAHSVKHLAQKVVAWAWAPVAPIAGGFAQAAATH